MNKKEIIIATGLVWPVSSNKWKAPKVIKQLVSDSISLIELEFEKMLDLEKKKPGRLGESTQTPSLREECSHHCVTIAPQQKISNDLTRVEDFKLISFPCT